VAKKKLPTASPSSIDGWGYMEGRIYSLGMISVMRKKGEAREAS